MENKNLKRQAFDHYLMAHFFMFLRKEGNHIQIGNGKALKPGVKYKFTDAPNRNRKVNIVLWKKLILNHFLKFNYN